jgi:hypothetical protein
MPFCNCGFAGCAVNVFLDGGSGTVWNQDPLNSSGIVPSTIKSPMSASIREGSLWPMKSSVFGYACGMEIAFKVVRRRA